MAQAGPKPITDCPVERAARDIARHAEIRKRLAAEAFPLREEFQKPLFRRLRVVADMQAALQDCASWRAPETPAGLAAHLMIVVATVGQLAASLDTDEGWALFDRVGRIVRADLSLLRDLHGVEVAALGFDHLMEGQEGGPDADVLISDGR